MGTRVRSAPKTDNAADVAAMALADTFVVSNRERKAAEKKYGDAKASLFLWLGLLDSRALPDGRTVTRTSTPIAEESAPRSAFNRVTLVVSPPPAPA